MALVKRVRMRYVEVSAENGGKPCKGLKGESRVAHSILVPRSRFTGQKVTIMDGAEYDEKPCKADVDVKKCDNALGGKKENFWAPWGEWGPCISKCLKKGKKTNFKGVRERKRRCMRVHNKNDGCMSKAQKGNGVQQEPCESICPPGRP